MFKRVIQSAAAISAAVVFALLSSFTPAAATDGSQTVVSSEPTPTASPSPSESTVALPVRPVNVKKIFASRSRADVAAIRALAPHDYKGYFRTAKYAKWYAERHIWHRYGWGKKQFKCLVTLWQKESSWRPSSTMSGYRFLGIPQLSRGTVVASGYTVAEFRASTELQIQLGAKYIAYRDGYGSPCKALKHFQRKHWY